MPHEWKNADRNAKGGIKRVSKPLNYAASEASPVSESAETRVTWRDFLTLAKPGILRSNLFVTLAGFWLASRWNIDWLNLLATLAGTMLIVGASGVFNNYLDREMDTKMERTKNRALPTGKIAPSVVLTYGIVLGVLGLAILFAFCGVLTGICGAIGMFAYVVLYTMWLKRTSTWSTSLGGISGAMPPVIGYVAVTNTIDMGAVLLFLWMFLWQPPHFWALGIRRVEEYRAAGFPILPVVKGIRRTQWQMLPYIVLLLPVPILMYAYGYVGMIFTVASIAITVLWLFFAVKGLAKGQDPDAWGKKVFMYSIYYMMVTFLLMIIDTAH
nr:heme o synthase [Saccharibacillus endophyticus]